MSKYILLLWMVVLVGLTGCQDETDVSSAETPAALVSIPMPDFERMEPLVREQLQIAQDSLDVALAAEPQDPETLSRLFGALGQRYQAYQYEEAARACFLNARTLDADAFQWAYYLGHLLKKGAFNEESLMQFEQALALNPDYLPTYIALAEGYIGANRVDEAEELLNKARGMDEANAGVFVGLGQIASIQNAHEEAVTYLEMARRLAPEASRINYPLGMAYRALGNQDKARHFLAQQGGTRPPLNDPLMDDLQALRTGAYMFRLQGNRAYLEGRYTDALDAYRQAVAADPDNPEFRTNLAVVLVALNRIDEAKESLEESLRLNPTREVALFSMGTLLAKEGRDADAIPYYERALRSNPGNVDARFNMANAHFRLGRNAEAATHYAEVVERDPQNHQARYRQGWALVRVQQWEPARTVLEAGYAAHPNDIEIANLLARLLAACPVDTLRDGLRAHNIAQQLMTAEGSLRNAEVLAMALAEVGRFEEAVALQERGLASVQQAGRADLEERMAVNLTRYRNQQPARGLEGV